MILSRQGAPPERKTSRQNSLLQQVRRAVVTGRPMDNGALVAEGPHMLAEALASPWPVETVFFSSGAGLAHPELLARAGQSDVRLIEVSERAFSSVRDTGHTQGILALIQPRRPTLAEVLAGAGPLVILDGIQDPGNAGTILRSVEAFSGCGVVLCEGCVRVSNGKLLRAAAGSLFRLPFVENVSCADVINELKRSRRKLLALTAGDGMPLPQADLSASLALVVGSEGHGVSSVFLTQSQPLSIPTHAVESLNAAVACSVALYEVARQRRLRS